MIQMTVKQLDLGGPELEIAGARDEVVASQGNVTCGDWGACLESCGLECLGMKVLTPDMVR